MYCAIYRFPKEEEGKEEGEGERERRKEKRTGKG